MLSTPPASTRSARAGLNLHAAQRDGLQARAAATVELQARHVDTEAGIERGDAPDRRRLAVGVALAEDHVVDLLGGQRGAAHQLGDDGRSELGRRHVAEHAAKPPTGVLSGSQMTASRMARRLP